MSTAAHDLVHSIFRAPTGVACKKTTKSMQNAETPPYIEADC
jgi:hypothetical protein